MRKPKRRVSCLRRQCASSKQAPSAVSRVRSRRGKGFDLPKPALMSRDYVGLAIPPAPPVMVRGGTTRTRFNNFVFGGTELEKLCACWYRPIQSNCVRNFERRESCYDTLGHMHLERLRLVVRSFEDGELSLRGLRNSATSNSVEVSLSKEKEPVMSTIRSFSLGNKASPCEISYLIFGIAYPPMNSIRRSMSQF